MATESYGILMVAIFLPLLLSPVAYFIGKRRGVSSVTWFTFGILSFSTILLIIPGMGLSSVNPIYEESYTWSQFGNFGLKLDGFSSPFAVTIYILSTVLVIFSRSYMIRKIGGQFDNLRVKNNPTKKHDESYYSHNEDRQVNDQDTHNHRNGYDIAKSQVQQEHISQNKYNLEPSQSQTINTQMGLYFALFLVFSMGMVGTVLSTNLIEFYVFFELTLVPAFLLVALFGYQTRKRVSLMFFFWTHVGAVLLLLGILSMGLFTGGFDFDTVRENSSKIPSEWMGLIVFAVVVGIAVKLGAFGLHIWIPHTYAESPTPISALIAGPMSAIGVYALLRIWVDLLAVSYSDYSIYVNLWGVVTMIYGGAMALMQDDIKKLLAYSSISHMGYIIFGIGSSSILGITGSTMMWVSHALGETILFMMAGAIIMKTGTRSLSNLGGIARKMPYTGTITMIGVLTMIGVPPTVGFMSEWILFNGALQTGAENMDSFRVVLFSLAILTTILTASYLLRMFKKVFLGPMFSEYNNLRDINKYLIISISVVGAMSLLIGVYPDPLINPVIGYTEAIFSDSPEIVSLPITEKTQIISDTQTIRDTNNDYIQSN